jgi:hypothetical protein
VSKPKWHREVLSQLVSTWQGSIIVLFVGMAIGGWISSWSACADHGCEVNAGLIEAAGTWVGGVGTIIAVYWAGATYRREQHLHDQRQAEIERTQDEQEERLQHQADQVELQITVGHLIGPIVKELRFTAKNGTNGTPLFKLRGYHEVFLDSTEIHEIRAGHDHTWSVNEPRLPNGAKLVIPEQGRPQWLAAEVEGFVVSFEMNGRIWSRIGTNPAEDHGPAAGA